MKSLRLARVFTLGWSFPHLACSIFFFRVLHTIFSHFRRMPLHAQSLWPGRQPCRPRLVYGRRGGEPSYVAPRSRNPPTGRRRDSPISSSLFSHGPPPVRSWLRARQQSQSSPDPAGKDSATSSPILTEAGT